MAGRRRRASSSSVETVNNDRINWRRDTDLVEPASSEEELDARIFELRDAVVLNKDGTTLENALDVRLKGPFIVRGYLVIDDPEQRDWLVSRVRSPVAVEVSQCGKYSVGEIVDEKTGKYKPGLWLAGHGCWFEISPAAEYVAIFRDICTAITMYFSIHDIYQENTVGALNKAARSTDPIKKISPVLHKYAARIGENLTVEEAVARCDKFAGFLLSQCVQGQADASVIWKDTFFFQWLTKRHPTINAPEMPHRNDSARPPVATSQYLPSTENQGLRQSSSELPASQAGARSGSVTSTGKSHTAVSEGMEDVSMRQRSSRSRSAVVNESLANLDLDNDNPHTPGQVPHVMAAASPLGEEDSPLASVIKAIEWVVSDMKKVNVIPPTTVLSKIYANYHVPGYQKYSGSYKVPVKEIIHYNSHALLANLDKQKFENTEFWAWLQEISTTELKLEALKPSDLPYTLAPRKSLNKPRGSAKDRPTAQANKRLGDVSEDEPFTRPPLTGKGIGKGLKTPATRKPGKSSLRPSTASRKRFYSQIESEEEEDSDMATKRSHYFSDEDNSMDESGDGNVSMDEPIKLVLRADKVPSATPQSANGTWACEEEDCDYVVRGADEQECQERIQKHFQDHEEQVQRVELALTEGNRGHQKIKTASPSLPSTAAPPPSPLLAASPSGMPTPAPTSSASKAAPKSPSPQQLPPSGKRQKRLSFRAHLRQFRRPPHSVSDRISKLTKFQPSTREDQEARRKAAERRGELRRRYHDDDDAAAAAGDQEESDSMTE